MHNKSIKAYHLFCQVLQFCEALKQDSIWSKGPFIVLYLKEIDQHLEISITLVFLFCTILSIRLSLIVKFCFNMKFDN